MSRIFFHPLFAFEVEEAEDEKGADDSDKTFYFVQAVGEGLVSFPHLQSNEAEKSGPGKKGKKNQGVKFLGRDSEATAKGGHKRYGDDGDRGGDEDKKLIADAFLEFGLDFFYKLPGEADVFTKPFDSGPATEINCKIN